MNIKKNDDKRAMTIELVRNGEVITIPKTAKSMFKATNGMCKEMVEVDNKYVVVFAKEDTSKTGFYNAEVEVTYEDKRVETFPEDSFIKFRIYGNIECEVC